MLFWWNDPPENQPAIKTKFSPQKWPHFGPPTATNEHEEIKNDHNTCFAMYWDVIWNTKHFPDETPYSVTSMPQQPGFNPPNSHILDPPSAIKVPVEVKNDPYTCLLM